MQCRRIGIIVATIAVAGVYGQAGSAKVADNEPKCQSILAVQSTKHRLSVYKAYEKCLKNVTKGKDCDFNALLQRIEKAEQKLEKGLRKACVGTAPGDEQVDDGVGLLDDLDFLPDEKCADSTESDGALSFREKLRCIVSQNFDNVGEELRESYGCTRYPMSFSGFGGSQTELETLVGPSSAVLQGTLDVCISPLEKNGKRAVIIPLDSISFEPVDLLTFRVCGRVVGAGVGQIDCDGDTVAGNLPHVCAFRDHETTPSTVASLPNNWSDSTYACRNSFPYDTPCTPATAAADCGDATACILQPRYGASDDPKCVKKEKTSNNFACLEGDCDGSAGGSDGDGVQKDICLGCNINANGSTHGGACNSATAYYTTGTTCDINSGPRVAEPCCRDSDCWSASHNGGKCRMGPATREPGEMVVAINIITEISTNDGSDNQDCTADDTYLSRGFPATVLLTTGYSQSGIADAVLDGVEQGARIWKDSTDCGLLGSCAVARTGVPKLCTGSGSFVADNDASDLELVTTFPIIDGPLGDAVTLMRFVGD